jgi:hypothetical protein
MISTKQEKPQGNPNPSPATRFGAENGNPQSPGGWKKENVVSYQFKRFINMTEQEFREFSKTPKSAMSMAERLAYNRVLAADKSLPDLKEILDRTEGKAAQSIDMTTNGKDMPSPIFGGLSASDPE